MAGILCSDSVPPPHIIAQKEEDTHWIDEAAVCPDTDPPRPAAWSSRRCRRKGGGDVDNQPHPLPTSAAYSHDVLELVLAKLHSAVADGDKKLSILLIAAVAKKDQIFNEV